METLPETSPSASPSSKVPDLGAVRHFRCAKCGRNTWASAREVVLIRWHPTSDACSGFRLNVPGEHLHLFCECGFEWGAAPDDQMVYDSASGEWTLASPLEPP